MIALERPLGLAAFALPLLVLVLHRVRQKPEPWATGTLALWREVAEHVPDRNARARHAVPPRLWILIAALCCGALALAGPRPKRPPAARMWRVVVDRSPSMYLPWRASGAATRLARALAALEPLLRELALSTDRILWTAPGSADGDERGGDRPPEEWRAAPPIAASEIEWSTFDAPGTIWVTDRAPQVERREAGLVASGGELAPGCIARAGTDRLDWDGAQIVAVPNALAPATSELMGSDALAAEIASVVSLWADDRGLVPSAADGAEVEVAVHAVRASERRSVAAARDGWSLRGSAASSGAPRNDALGSLKAWLVTEDGLPLVAAGPGRVYVALDSIDAIDGDPAAFAVSWAELLDASRSPPRGAVSVSERASAGSEERAAPAAPPPSEESSAPPFPFDASLAVLAFSLALIATARR